VDTPVDRWGIVAGGGKRCQLYQFGQNIAIHLFFLVCPNRPSGSQKLFDLIRLQIQLVSHRRTFGCIHDFNVVWFAQKGFPAGHLGGMLRMVYEIKVNGLEYLFKPLRNL
jgi:uncharacterized protein (DUF3820 family)